MRLRRLITRRRAKWAATIATAAMLVLAVASSWFRFTYYGGVRFGQGQFHIISGLVWVNVKFYQQSDVIPTVNHGYRFVKLDDPKFLMGFSWNHEPRQTIRNVSFSTYNVRVPLWFPCLLIAVPTAWLWRVDRRVKPWQCAKCRYDLRGLEGGGDKVCPECGQARRSV